MIDLIERLRARRNSEYDYATQGAEWVADALCQEAAAEIAALSAKLAEAEQSLGVARENFHTMQGTALNLRALAEAAEARVAELEKALKPFALYAACALVKTADGAWAWHDRVRSSHTTRNFFHPSDFGAALAATKEPKP